MKSLMLNPNVLTLEKPVPKSLNRCVMNTAKMLGCQKLICIKSGALAALCLIQNLKNKVNSMDSSFRTANTNLKPVSLAKIYPVSKPLSITKVMEMCQGTVLTVQLYSKLSIFGLHIPYVVPCYRLPCPATPRPSSVVVVVPTMSVALI